MEHIINEADRKKLTLFLGECWNSGSYEKGDMKALSIKEMRRFDTPSDQHAVFSRLVEVGKWSRFYWVTRKIDSEPDNVELLFINPERFCKLAADYLGEEKCQK